MLFFNIVLLYLASIIQAIKDQYIITFDRSLRITYDAQLNSVTSLFNSRNSHNAVLYQYRNIMYGATVAADPVTLSKIKALPNVKSVHPDGIAYGAATQHNAPWGLTRISHRKKLDSYTNSTYLYDDKAGNGITVYVVDSGIYTQNIDFGGRARWGANFITGSPDIDEHGHGTHCAGTVGGNVYGVAKKVNLVAVKVLNKNNSGPWSAIIAGMDWAANDAKGKKALISMSIGGDKADFVNQAANDVVDQGIFMAVSAGNDNRDACLASPASAEKVFTVGATNSTDQKASFSNWGSCIDILGPGVSILSDGTTSPNATRIMSGTSMATPHISGIAATLMSQGVPFDKLRAKIIEIATKDAISGFNSDTPNLLGFNGYSQYY